MNTSASSSTPLGNVKISNKLIIGFTAVFVAVVAMSCAVFFSASQLEKAQRWDAHTNEVLFEIRAVSEAMVNQETGVRGYLISGNRDFLQPFEQGVEAFDASVAKLRTLTADNSKQQARLAHLDTEANAWREDVAKPEIALMSVAATQEQGRAMESSGQGKAKMDAVRVVLGEMAQDEQALQTQRSATREKTQIFLKSSLVVGGLIAAAIAVLMAWLLSMTISRPIMAMTAAMTKLASGDYRVDVPASGQRDEVGQMAQAVEVFKNNGLRAIKLEEEALAQRSMSEQERAANEAEKARVAAEDKVALDALAGGLSAMAHGDLTHRFTVEVAPRSESLKGDFNAAIAQLQQAISVVVGNVSGIRSGASEISQAADDLSRRTEQQAASLEETAAALDEITATVNKTASGARQASDVVQAARGDAEKSGMVVRDAVSAMQAIEGSSSQINQIIGVIDEIAFQTNLLALNAGVEAARAGDAGRGFAVVASEVRALAQRSAEAAKEIKTLISASTGQVGAGVKLVGETGEALQRIVDRVAEIDSLVTEIAASAQEQAVGLAQVNTAVNQMDQVTQQNAAMVEQSTAASHSLAQEAESLQASVSQFRVGSHPQASHAPAPVRKPAPAAKPANRMVAALKTIGRGGAALKVEPQSEGWEEF